jgi:hypothetical protein
MIANLDEIFNHTLNINWLYDLISLWKVPLMWFHKNIWMKFFIQMSISLKTNNIFEKKYYFQKVMRIALNVLCFKSILCVSQNTRWNKTKSTTKTMQNVLFKWIHSLAQLAPHNVLNNPLTNTYIC